MLNDDKVTDGSVFIIGFRYEKTNVFAYQDTINRYESIGLIEDFEDSSIIDDDDRDAVMLRSDYNIQNLSSRSSLAFICQYEQ